MIFGELKGFQKFLESSKINENHWVVIDYNL